MPLFNYLSKYKTKGRILEVGCSAGFFLQIAQKNGWEVFGIELSKDTSEIARDRYGLNVLTGQLEKDTYPPSYFDAVVMWDAIEHLRNPVETTKIVNGILKNRGVFLCTTPNINGLYPKLSFYFAKLLNIKYWPHWTPPGHLFEFSKNTITRILTNNGFSGVSIKTSKAHVTLRDYLRKGMGKIRFLKYLLYYCIFIPIIKLGPYLGAGERMFVKGTKYSEKEN